jgi:hypothetical protein
MNWILGCCIAAIWHSFLQLRWIGLSLAQGWSPGVWAPMPDGIGPFLMVKGVAGTGSNVDALHCADFHLDRRFEAICLAIERVSYSSWNGFPYF